MTKTDIGEFDLSGRAAFITGGGTGLGYFMARGLARSGARVVIAARRGDILKSAAETLSEETGGSVIPATVDLADRSSITNAVEHARTELGHVDILIGNAGLDGLEPIDNVTDATMDQLWQVNVASNIALVRAFLPGMRQKKWGRILLSSSIASRVGYAREGTSVYSATKGALNAFARTVAAEAGHDGITANTLVIGPIATDMLRGAISHFREAGGQAAADAFINSVACMTSLGRLGEPNEIEPIVRLLASDAGSYITGAEIPVDGGLTAMASPNDPA